MKPNLTDFISDNEKCGGPDLNRRTPTGMDPESIAFNLARQPPPLVGMLYSNYKFIDEIPISSSSYEDYKIESACKVIAKRNLVFY